MHSHTVPTIQKRRTGALFLPPRLAQAPQATTTTTMFFGGDPFAGMHGHGGSGRRSARSRDVDTNKLYETLGVSKFNDKNGWQDGRLKQ